MIIKNNKGLRLALDDVYKSKCPKCNNKTFKVVVSDLSISVNCAKCKRNFLGCWNEWVLNMDGIKT